MRRLLEHNPRGREDRRRSRSAATGYLPKREFEAMVDAFFAQPQTSVRGWEPAADAQARIVCAVERIVSPAFGNGDLAISVMGPPEHCSIVALRAGQSIGVTISPRPMAEIGSPSIEQVEDSCMTGGVRSMRQHKEVPGTGTAYDSAARRVSATDSSAGRRCC
jgi:hypothetical protein